MKVNIINHSKHDLPSYATEYSAGLDLRANIDSPIELKPFERQLIPTGLFIELHKGYEAQIRPRSGLALKQGITCLNSPGTIDADYRGEIKVILINLSGENQVVENGDRIAQAVFQKVERVSWEEVDSINNSERNQGGFGHTGKN